MSLRNDKAGSKRVAPAERPHKKSANMPAFCTNSQAEAPGSFAL
jgi:hypothetical protein